MTHREYTPDLLVMAAWDNYCQTPAADRDGEFDAAYAECICEGMFGYDQPSAAFVDEVRRIARGYVGMVPSR